MTSRVFTSRGYALAVPNFFRHMGILSPVTNPATGRSCRMKSPSGCTVSWIGPEASNLCHRGCAMHAPVALRSNRPWQRAAISFSLLFSPAPPGDPCLVRRLPEFTHGSNPSRVLHTLQSIHNIYTYGVQFEATRLTLCPAPPHESARLRGSPPYSAVTLHSDTSPNWGLPHGAALQNVSDFATRVHTRPLDTVAVFHSGESSIPSTILSGSSGYFPGIIHQPPSTPTLPSSSLHRDRVNYAK